MLKRKKYMVGLLVMALSISFANSNVALAVSNSTSTTVASNYNGTGKTGIDKNNITWSYEVCTDGTISIWQHDELSGKVEIPEKIDGLTVSKIKAYGLSESTKITSVKIPSTVKDIEKLAFFGCTSLSSIEIPKSVSEIDENVFENTPWLTNQRNSNPLVVVNGILIDGRDASGDIVIPDNVTIIGDSAFAYIDLEHKYQYGNGVSITSVKIPEGVNKIGENAFGNSPNLTHVEIPFTVTEIGAFAFSACTVEIEVPNKAVKIGERAFSKNPKIGTRELQQGWYNDGAHWYWLWSNGSKLTGWNEENGNWYYFYGNGQMATEFTGLGGEAIYYFSSQSDGRAVMVTGWQKISGDWYYFNPNSDGYKGIMKRGWIYDGGNWYYLYYNGQMAHNTTIDGYYVNSSGAWV